jgi:hypothetical protein
MNTRQKIIGLAALPLAGLLAAGGTAVAQASGSPADTQVVQQAVIHRAVDPGPSDSVTGGTHPACQRQVRDRDCGACDGYHPTPAVKTVTSTVVHARHDGTCRDYADR